VICDAHGTVLTLANAKCSIQRRHQKLIEESPSPALDPAQREAMELAAERACVHIRLRNAGTFEFSSHRTIVLVHRAERAACSRASVTELVTSLDIVRTQIRVAAGERLEHGGRARRAATRSRCASTGRGHDFRRHPAS